MTAAPRAKKLARVMGIREPPRGRLAHALSWLPAAYGQVGSKTALSRMLDCESASLSRASAPTLAAQRAQNTDSTYSGFDGSGRSYYP